MRHAIPPIYEGVAALKARLPHLQDGQKKPRRCSLTVSISCGWTIVNSGAHTAQRRTIPETVCLVCLPPYCPARNTIERGWRNLKAALASRQ